MMGSVRIIFFSPTHTSAQIAYAVAEGLGIEPEVSDVTCDFPSTDIWVEEEVTIVAAPVYGGRIPPPALERIRRFRSHGKPVIPIVVYGNRHYDDALLELGTVLVENGFKLLAGGAFIGEHSYSRPEYPVAANRPDAGDLEKARAFGAKIKAALTAPPTNIQLNLPGQFPYKEYSPSPGAPVTDETLCTQCEYCLGACPVEAISIPDGEMFSDPDICIHCCACVKFCPEQARTFETPFSKYLYENFSTRREPEWFV